MTQVISILNLQKGGGKTTTALNLATALKLRGHRTLVADLSPEESISQRIRLQNPARSARLENPAKIISTLEGWHLMRAAVAIPLLHARTLCRLALNTMFQDELRSLFEAYDYVLVDCSNHELSVVTEVLALTDEVIVPLDSESLQFHDAVERLADLFASRLAFNPELKFGGVFLARYSPRFRRAREMLTTLFDVLGPVNCFSAYLPESGALREAEQRRVSVVTDAPTSQAAHAFYQLAEQLTNSAVPRIQTPTLLVTPGRARVEHDVLDAMPQQEALFEPVTLGPLTTWEERAESATDVSQALRYAVLSLLEKPDSVSRLELFELRVTERVKTARYADADLLVEQGEFLVEHELNHYAAQLLRRATELNPALVRGWAVLARVTNSEEERAFALERCLALDEGMAAAELPAPARRPQTRTEPRAFVNAFAAIQGANG